MSRYLTPQRLFTLGALVVAIGATGCGEDADAVDTSPPDGADSRRIINVRVERLASRPFTDVIRLTGTVIADRSVIVAAEEGGKVAEVIIDKGQFVRAGQPIAQLDDELLRAQRDEAQASLSLAYQLWERTRRLFDEDGIGTENEYLQARFTCDQARARLQLIEARLARTKIRAPFDGVLDARHVEVGSIVAPGTPIATLVDLSPLKVTAGVPERYAADVEAGAQAKVIFPALADTSDAIVEFVGAAVHPGNRTFPVELSLQSATRSVKPEMVVDVVLERHHLENVVVVPRQALVRTEDGFCAFVAVMAEGEEAVAEVRNLTLGASANDQVVILSGLSSDDRLVVLGQTQIADGDRLRIVSAR